MKEITTAALAAATIATAANITVDPSATKQEIIGFGGASVYYQNWIANLPAEDQEVLFDTAFTGLNLSLLRVANWLQDESKDLTDDINIIKAAQKRLGSHLKIEMSSWSAPGNLKPSGSLNGYDGHSKSDKTLKKTNQHLIETLEEVRKIQDDGRARRAAAEEELGRIEGELKQKLLEIKG